jgi:hypothetical protein
MPKDFWMSLHQQQNHYKTIPAPPHDLLVMILYQWKSSAGRKVATNL